jgi:hypothetical protein
LAFDTSGDLIEGNYGNSTVGEIAPNGTQSTIASGLNGSSGLAFDSNGNLFVTSYGNGTISEITPGGSVSTFASGLSEPIGLVIGVAVPEPSSYAIIIGFLSLGFVIVRRRVGSVKT